MTPLGTGHSARTMVKTRQIVRWSAESETWSPLAVPRTGRLMSRMVRWDTMRVPSRNEELSMQPHFDVRPAESVQYTGPESVASVAELVMKYRPHVSWDHAPALGTLRFLQQRLGSEPETAGLGGGHPWRRCRHTSCTFRRLDRCRRRWADSVVGAPTGVISLSNVRSLSGRCSQRVRRAPGSVRSMGILNRAVRGGGVSVRRGTVWASPERRSLRSGPVIFSTYLGWVGHIVEP